MENPFNLWSTTNTESKKDLKPNLWYKWWDEFSSEEKKNIWLNLKYFLFDLVKETYWYKSYDNFYLYWNTQKQEVLEHSISIFSNNYKSLWLCERYLKNKWNWENVKIDCAEDFLDIFFNESEDKVLELLSIYVQTYIDATIGNTYWDDKNKVISTRISNIIEYIEDVFSQFQVKYKVTETWFLPRQEEKIFELAYEPTIKILSDKKWWEVSKYLWKAFENHRKKKYGDVIMNCSSAIQNFLQILVHWKVWKWEISKLFKEWESKWIIKSDIFTEELSLKFNRLLARERKEKTDAHVEIEKAVEKDALYILNLTIIHLQNWMP